MPQEIGADAIASAGGDVYAHAEQLPGEGAHYYTNRIAKWFMRVTGQAFDLQIGSNKRCVDLSGLARVISETFKPSVEGMEKDAFRKLVLTHLRTIVGDEERIRKVSKTVPDFNKFLEKVLGDLKLSASDALIEQYTQVAEAVEKETRKLEHPPIVFKASTLHPTELPIKIEQLQQLSKIMSEFQRYQRAFSDTVKEAKSVGVAGDKVGCLEEATKAVAGVWKAAKGSITQLTRDYEARQAQWDTVIFQTQQTIGKARASLMDIYRRDVKNRLDTTFSGHRFDPLASETITKDSLNEQKELVEKLQRLQDDFSKNNDTRIQHEKQLERIGDPVAIQFLETYKGAKKQWQEMRGDLKEFISQCEGNMKTLAAAEKQVPALKHFYSAIHRVEKHESFSKFPGANDAIQKIRQDGFSETKAPDVETECRAWETVFNQHGALNQKVAQLHPSLLSKDLKASMEEIQKELGHVVGTTPQLAQEHLDKIDTKLSLLKQNISQAVLHTKKALREEFIEKGGAWKKAWVVPPSPTESVIANDEAIKSYLQKNLPQSEVYYTLLDYMTTATMEGSPSLSEDAKREQIQQMKYLLTVAIDGNAELFTKLQDAFVEGGHFRCAAEQKRLVDTLYKGCVGEKMNLEGYIRQRVDTLKTQAIEEVVWQRHPDCGNPEYHWHPQLQFAHRMSGYLAEMGEKYGLANSAAASDDPLKGSTDLNLQGSELSGEVLNMTKEELFEKIVHEKMLDLAIELAERVNVGKKEDPLVRAMWQWQQDVKDAKDATVNISGGLYDEDKAAEGEYLLLAVPPTEEQEEMFNSYYSPKYILQVMEKLRIL